MPRESAAARRRRAGDILARLKAEYPDAHCELDHRNPYQLLVATILSAQCTDARVNMVTPALFARYPDPESLAAAKQEDVEALIRSTGFFRNKAKSLIGMARAVVAGHDGWLYLAQGDNGVDVPRPEGDRLVVQGGSILRCRPDGRDLHVFAGGLRNIYDVALDEELNVLVRDNENDGGTYMIRVCHSFFGADHTARVPQPAAASSVMARARRVRAPRFMIASGRRGERPRPAR